MALENTQQGHGPLSSSSSVITKEKQYVIMAITPYKLRKNRNKRQTMKPAGIEDKKKHTHTEKK